MFAVSAPNARFLRYTAIGFLFAAVAGLPAAAAVPLETAVYKAVVLKQESKKVKGPKGHEFNIKPVNVSRSGTGFVVSGQLSHHLTLRTDDQYYYTIAVSPAGTITRIEERINRGGLTSMALDLHVGDLVEHGTGIDSETANKVIGRAGRFLGRKLDGSWEGDARRIVILIGAQVAKHYR